MERPKRRATYEDLMQVPDTNTACRNLLRRRLAEPEVIDLAPRATAIGPRAAADA